MTRFLNTSCSQCGMDLGPGDEGVSHCSDHLTPRQQQDRPAALAASVRQQAEVKAGNAKHTPGPWQAMKGSPGGHPDIWEIASDLGDHEYEVVGWASTRRFSTLTRFDDEVIQANARLIAAAPELLEALEQMVAWNGKRGGPDDALLPADQQDADVRKALVLIARLKGGAA